MNTKSETNEGRFCPLRVQDPSKILCLLKECTEQKDLGKGSKLHAYIHKHKFLEDSSCVASALVNMYSRCNALAKAQQTVDMLPVRDAVTWTALISGYVQHGKGKEALQYFDNMQCEGHSPIAATFTYALKACGRIQALPMGKTIHDQIVRLGMLEKSIVLGNTLVDMYARCGAFSKAQQVLQELPVRNVVSWNTLMAGYVQQGKGEEALKCFDSMHCEGYFPDVVTFISALKACGNIAAVSKADMILGEIISLNILEKHSMLGSSLVGMYAKCGVLAKAQRVLEELPVRDVFMWTPLIAGYAQQGQGEEALKCFNNMQREGHIPDVVTFTCALNACGSIGAIAEGEKIHHKIASLCMSEEDVMLGNALVDMYARCGALYKAQRVLDDLPIRDVVTWNALIAGYAEHDEGEEALNCFDSMQCEGHSPNLSTLMCALKACGNIGAVAKGAQIHEKIVSLGMLEKNIVLGSALVDMYARCGAVAQAHKVLRDLPFRDMVMWTALIAGYVQQGQAEQALECFDNMQRDGHFPDAITFTCALKACGSIGAAAKGEEIHERIANLGLLEKDIILGNSLVDMYVKSGALAKAKQVLEELPIRNVATWNALITGYAQQGLGDDASKCLDSMHSEGHSPDAVTFICALKACETCSKIEIIHDKIMTLGMLEKNVMLGTTLVDMYARCGATAKARQVLAELPLHDVTTWNALIAGCSQQGQNKEVLKCYDSMQHKGHFPNLVTFIFALKACGAIGAVAKGKIIHEKIVSLGMLEESIELGSILVDMYARCGALSKAQQVLKELPVRDVVTWTALIAGYVQEGQGEEALKCFESMQQDGKSPDAVAFTCALKACGSIGAIAKGEEFHDKIVNLGMLEKDIILGSTLVDMYVKCAAIPKALEVLKELPNQDVVNWNTMIGGYAQQGQSREALNCFEMMQSKVVKPDTTTLACMLNAYSHSGLLDQAEILFSVMSTEYVITPNFEHFCCMVDLFGRAGNLNRALVVIEKMPSDENLPVWLALLGACRKWRDGKIGKLAFERAFHLETSDLGIIFCMENIYTLAGMEEYADKKNLEWDWQFES